MSRQALLLFAHGARDPRWARPFEALARRLRLARPGLPVSLAYLELMSPRLPQAVAELAAQGCTDISIVPVFLGQGGHVLRDLPALLEQVRTAHPGVTLKLADAVGESEAVQAAMAAYCLSSLE